MQEYKVWLLKLVTLAAIFLVVFPLLAGILSQTGSITGEHKVSVIEVTGIIYDSENVLTHLYKQAKDDSVKAIVLRIDSPGGAVGPSEEIYSAVKRLKADKPIVASMGNVAASGGLYSAVGASKVFAQPSTQTGSIGVILQIPNFTQIADKIGVKVTTVKSGALKDVGNQFREMTDDERMYLENTTAKIHDSFIRAVSEGRNIPTEKVRTFADGRVILGSEAKELGLIDEFGDVYDAARAALLLANEPVPADKVPTLVYANKKRGFWNKLVEASSELPVQALNAIGVTPGPAWNYLAW